LLVSTAGATVAAAYLVERLDSEASGDPRPTAGAGFNS